MPVSNKWSLVAAILIFFNSIYFAIAGALRFGSFGGTEVNYKLAFVYGLFGGVVLLGVILARAKLSRFKALFLIAACVSCVLWAGELLVYNSFRTVALILGLIATVVSAYLIYLGWAMTRQRR